MIFASQSLHSKLIDIIEKVIKNVYPDISSPSIVLSVPPDPSSGDYACPVSFVISKHKKISPMKVSSLLKEAIYTMKEKGQIGNIISDVEIASPGFLNIHVNSEILIKSVMDVVTDLDKPIQSHLSGKKIMVEFAHPNTHKEFHIGHLRNICIGESLSRIFTAIGAKVFRANYEGDVGLHVAKAIWGVYKMVEAPSEKNQKKYVQALDAVIKGMSSAQKAEFLGTAYAKGSSAYDGDEESKKEIMQINKQIYSDPDGVLLWKETRKISLDYFDTVYRRLGTTFDRLFFESEVAEVGRNLVIDSVKKGIFVKDTDGSIYFPGEKYGLNNCVFVTREDYATYEGKDVALEDLEYQTFPYDLDIHVVANEQINFFQIAFAALEQLFPYQKGRQYHLAYGMVKMMSGKISSRTGDVLTADELIDMAKKSLSNLTSDLSLEEREASQEHISVAAVKYTMLKVHPKQDISFDIQRSVSLDGDSGPYLLYTYARCKSVMRKAGEQVASLSEFPNEIFLEERMLLRALVSYGDILKEAGEKYAPSILCGYLFELAQQYNTFYNKHSILGSDISPHISVFRLFLTHSTAALLEKGISLLGFETVERM